MGVGVRATFGRGAHVPDYCVRGADQLGSVATLCTEMCCLALARQPFCNQWPPEDALWGAPGLTHIQPTFN